MVSLGVFVAICLLYSANYHFNVVDDAYIGFVFVRNIATGHGMVFNPGERVEGYTNFLWLILMVPAFLLHRLSGCAFEPFVVAMNLASATLNLWLTYCIACRLWPQCRFWPLLPLALCLASNTFTVNAVLGMENHFQLTLMLLLILHDLSGEIRRVKTPVVHGMLLAAVVMTRPDGLLFVFAWSLAHIIGASPLSRAVVTRSLGAFALVYGAYFAARVSYYGQLLPNTFYQKMGSGLINALARGWEYELWYLRTEWFLPLALLMPVSWNKVPYFRLAFLFSVLHASYVLYIGGDFYPFFRFLVVLTPFWAMAVTDLLIMLEGSLVGSLFRLWRSGAAPVLVVFLGVYAGLGVLDGPYQWEIVKWARKIERKKRLFQWFGAQRHNDTDSLAIDAIGMAGFYSGLRIVDIHGLIHPEVARLRVESLGNGKAGHEKQMPFEMLLRRAPTYIRFGPYLESHPDFRLYGYYLRNDLPPDVPDRLLWVRDAEPPQPFPGTPRYNFEGELHGWVGSGSASVIRINPVSQSPDNQQPVRYFEGDNYLSTFSADNADTSTVRWSSPLFELKGSRLCLLVGGGRSSRVGVYIVVDGRAVAVERGANVEALGRRCLSISKWKGKTAQVIVLDTDTAPWGHIMVDDIFQSD